MNDTPIPQPNFLFFLPDQHRPDWLGSNPALPLRTSNLDRLARGGVRFENAYCNSPLCAPSRASIASGKSYERCGVRNNGQDYPLRQPTYYQSLRAAGYRVAGVGKFDLHKPTLDWGPDGSRLLEEWGFTEGLDNEGKIDGSNAFRANPDAAGPYLSFLRRRGLAEIYVREHQERKQHLGAYTTAVPDDAYCDNWLSENGLRFLRGFPTGQPSVDSYRCQEHARGETGSASHSSSLFCRVPTCHEYPTSAPQRMLRSPPLRRLVAAVPLFRYPRPA